MPASRFGDEMIAATVSAGRIRAAGLDVAYDRAGEGPPLVLVHGGAGDAREWRPQLTGLADDFTVIAWDEPGAGRSSDVPADFRPAETRIARHAAEGLTTARSTGRAGNADARRGPRVLHELKPLRRLQISLAWTSHGSRRAARRECGSRLVDAGENH
jgi:pimeloyl-ACP methyl ester carboxylesterase